MSSLDYYLHDRLFVVRLRSPDSAASREIATRVEAHAKKLGQPLMFALIIGTDCLMPEPDAQRQLAADQLLLGPLCADMRTLILGRELRQTLVRSLVTGFAMLPGRTRPKVDDCVAQLLDAAVATLACERDWLEEQLIEAGVISKREASWTSPGLEAPGSLDSCDHPVAPHVAPLPEGVLA